MSDLLKQVSKLIDVKSIVTLVMTAGMIVMLTGAVNPSQEATTLQLLMVLLLLTFLQESRILSNGSSYW